MTYIGGLRARLIHNNIYDLIVDGLTDLGWLDTDREHEPVTVRADQVDNDEKVAPNIVTVTVEDDVEEPMEMGSNLVEKNWSFYVDVYAEDDILALHLATDIVDVLNGRFTQTVSRMGPDVTIYDLTQSAATPIPVCTVEIVHVEQNKSRFAERPWQKYWRVVSFTVVDHYDTEEDA
jgi:hypothetical protein